MSREVTVAGRRIGDESPPFVVAEIGANHDGDVGKARELIEMAAEAGADAIKLQTYTTRELLADPEREITWGPPHQPTQERIGALFDRLSLPRDAHAELFELAQERGVVGFSTPFSVDGARFLDGLGVPAFKVASSDVSYPELLECLARTGKPVILSLGKATLEEAQAAVETLHRAGCARPILLHCIAEYPAPLEEMNLRVIPALREMYPESPVGLSDHSVGTLAASLAVSLGARVIEKHVTFDKAAPGPDHWFSADEAELRQLVRDVRGVPAALGDGLKRVMKCEEHERRTSTRSIVLAYERSAGHVLTRDDVRIVRPGWGISPRRLEEVLGRALSRSLPADTVLTWDHLETAES